jgi:hypothetical protein
MGCFSLFKCWERTDLFDHSFKRYFISKQLRNHPIYVPAVLYHNLSLAYPCYNLTLPRNQVLDYMSYRYAERRFLPEHFSWIEVEVEALRNKAFAGIRNDYN